MSATPTTTQEKIEAALESAASTPTFVSGEFGSVTNRSVEGLIALDRYNQGRIAREAGAPGFTVRRFKASGAHS